MLQNDGASGEVGDIEGTTIILFVVVHDWDCRRSKDYSIVLGWS